jgi:hypothetical protein
LPKVFVNEIVANPGPHENDAIELYNEETAAADISNWWLTDDFRTPKKYRFPSGSVISGKGFKVIPRAQFDPGSTNGFGLNALGEQIYLFSADPVGELTGWHHGFDFGAQAQGASFGRWVTSDGLEHYVPYSQPNLGLANPEPASGPVMISEIMYEPASLDGADNTRYKFIELADLTSFGQPFPLFDLSNPANTWQLRGGVDYDFPANFQFPESRLVVIVGFDPQRDVSVLADFRARYRLDKTVTILGPWGGSLSNTGNVLRLLKPLPPVTPPSTEAGQVPYALVEEVHFLPQSPWPSDAVGTGRSILRRSNSSLGGEPLNWFSFAATPGDRDTDGDGLPDGWEIANGLNPLSATGDDGPDGDPDGDGFTNYQEYLAGTSPRNPKSALLLSVMRDAPNAAVLTFPSGPSRTLTVLYRDNLNVGAWRVLITLTAPVEGGTMIWRDPPTNSTRFYRLRL